MADQPKELDVRVAELESVVKKLTETMTPSSTAQAGFVCSVCQICSTCVICQACSNCSICHVCSVCSVCRICRPVCSECTCGPCSQQ